MNTQRTSNQIDFYRENGFLIIDDFLNGSELSLWQDAVDEAVAQVRRAVLRLAAVSDRRVSANCSANIQSGRRLNPTPLR